MSDEPELVSWREGQVLIARLNRPERRNALSLKLLSLLGAAAVEAESSAEIRVLLVTGTGDKAFCAGMDLAEFASSENAGLLDDANTRGYMDLMYGRLSVPVVAAVNGAAVGGGLELLHGADLIVASDTATFGLPEVKRGLFAAGAGMLLGTRIPMSAALELVLTGDTIDAARAHQLGLVNRVVPPDDIMATALGYAHRIAANGPLGLAASKELLRAACIDTDRAAERAKAWQQVVFSSRDAQEGAVSFMAKRAPVWEGR